ncbi:unnamed protein product [Amaranthus hypochondriacus]
MENSTEVSPLSKQNYWKLNMNDFFPGESFKNWSTHKCALSNTYNRFKHRLTSRSEDANELGDIRQQSKNDMKRCLNWFDLIWFGFGSVIGAGIFVLTGKEAHDQAGLSIVISYIVLGLSAMHPVFCYTEFAVEIPVSGGSFEYLRIELGDFVAFIAAANILLKGIVGDLGLQQ